MGATRQLAPGQLSSFGHESHASSSSSRNPRNPLLVPYGPRRPPPHATFWICPCPNSPSSETHGIRTRCLHFQTSRRFLQTLAKPSLPYPARVGGRHAPSLHELVCLTLPGGWEGTSTYKHNTNRSRSLQRYVVRCHFQKRLAFTINTPSWRYMSAAPDFSCSLSAL